MYMVLLDTSLIFLVEKFSLLYKKDAPKVTQNSLNSKLFYLKDLNLHIPYIFLKQNKTKQTNKQKKKQHYPPTVLLSEWFTAIISFFFFD